MSVRTPTVTTLVCFTVFLFGLNLLVPPATPQARAGSSEIPIIYPVSVDALLKIGEGANEVLRSRGWAVKPFSAEGDPTRFSAVIDAAITLKAPVMITVGTQITNTALGPKYRSSLPPLVAGAIFNPAELESLGAAGLAPPRKLDIAVVSDHPDKTGEHMVDLIHGLLPSAKTLGVFVNRGEQNSKDSASSVTKVAAARGFKIQTGYLTSPADLTAVTRTLIFRGVEAILIPHDKIADSQASTVVQIAMQGSRGRSVPVFSLDDGTVEKHGVLACVSADYTAIGRRAATLALEALAGQPLRQKPIV